MKLHELGPLIREVPLPPETPLQMLVAGVLLDTTLTCPIYLRRADGRILGNRANTSEFLAEVLQVSTVDPYSAPRVSAKIVNRTGRVEVWTSSSVAYYRVLSVGLHTRGLVVTLTGNLLLISELGGEGLADWHDRIKEFHSRRYLRATVSL